MDNPLENIHWSNVVFNAVRDRHHLQSITTPFAINFLDEFEMQDILGRGVFGTTYRIVNRQTGAMFALKVLNKPDPVQLQKEVEALVELSKAPYCRPHVLCYYSAFAIPCLDPARRALETAAAPRASNSTIVSSSSGYPVTTTTHQNDAGSSYYHKQSTSAMVPSGEFPYDYNYHDQAIQQQTSLLLSPSATIAAMPPFTRDHVGYRHPYSTVMSTPSSSYITGNVYNNNNNNDTYITNHTTYGHHNHPEQQYEQQHTQQQHHDPCVDYVILTEYVPGQPLTSLIHGTTHAGRALTGCVGLYYLLGLLDAVNSVHEAGFVHLDIKPANLMVTPEGSMVLVDFGQACGGSMTCYTTGGDYKYQAPELRIRDCQQQAITMGFGQLEPWDERYEWVKMQSLQRADMYSVALTALEMFTGILSRAQVDILVHAQLPMMTDGGGNEAHVPYSTPVIETGMGSCIDQWIYHQLFAHPTQRQNAKESRQWLERCFQSFNTFATCSQMQ